MPAVRCDACGRLAWITYPVYGSPPEVGIDHEVCDWCRAGRPGTGAVEGQAKPYA